MADEESVTPFFQHLATRCFNELHLSDVTYAMLQAVPEFKKDFVRFFYPDLPTEEAIAVVRESGLPDSTGRPDFAFQGRSWQLIVENKLDDTNYHFDQYGHACPTACLGLIANHSVSGEPHDSRWVVRTWREFLDEFAGKTYMGATILFAGYLRYVKEVCGMKELRAFSLSSAGLDTLRSFNDMVEHVLKGVTSERISIAIRYNYVYNFGASWSGYYFDLKENQSGASTAGFFGIDYSSESPFISVYTDRENRSYATIVKNLPESSTYKTEHGKVNGDCVWLKMPQARYDELNRSATAKAQEEILSAFFTNCCMALAAALTAWGARASG